MYPAFPPERWAFPGTGEFQCYDRYILSNLQAAAIEFGREKYGCGGPDDAGTYCQWPQESRFFSDGGSWSEVYGQFFLQWYSQQLLDHADAVLGITSHVFSKCEVQKHAQVPFVYWWHHTQSHAVRVRF
jgi:beta-amylase